MQKPLNSQVQKPFNISHILSQPFSVPFRKKIKIKETSELKHLFNLTYLCSFYNHPLSANDPGKEVVVFCNHFIALKCFGIQDFFCFTHLFPPPKKNKKTIHESGALQL